MWDAAKPEVGLEHHESHVGRVEDGAFRELRGGLEGKWKGAEWRGKNKCGRGVGEGWMDIQGSRMRKHKGWLPACVLVCTGCRNTGARGWEDQA